MAHNAPGKHFRRGTSFAQLFTMFPDDSTAEEWFIGHRWPDGARCPHCDHRHPGRCPPLVAAAPLPRPHSSAEYDATTGPQVREIASQWLLERQTDVDLGLPEYDDRLRLWRVALLAHHNGREPVGELRIDDGRVVFSTDLGLVAQRVAAAEDAAVPSRCGEPISFRPVPSTVAAGDARSVLAEIPPDSVQLVFTSPPYYNAKPECHESGACSDYLALMEDIFGLWGGPVRRAFPCREHQSSADAPPAQASV